MHFVAAGVPGCTQEAEPTRIAAAKVCHGGSGLHRELTCSVAVPLRRVERSEGLQDDRHLADEAAASSALSARSYALIARSGTDAARHTEPRLQSAVARPT